MAPTRYRRLRLRALGMHCGACEKLVTMQTGQIDGVAAATGDAAAETVTVYLEHEVSLDDLAAAVEAAGFTPGTPFVLAVGFVSELPGPDGEVRAAAPAAPAPEREVAVETAVIASAVGPTLAESLSAGSGEPLESETLETSEVEPAAVQTECPILPPDDEESGPAPAALETVVVEGASQTVAASASADATFAVGGMTCASCSAIIEKVLGKTAGIHSAVVNLATEKLNVTYDPAVIDTDGIIAAVSGIGYTATLLGTPGAAAEAPGQGHARAHRHDVRFVRGGHREDAR